MNSFNQERQFYRRNVQTGLSITSKPLTKPNKLSIQPLLIDHGYSIKKSNNKSLNNINESFISEKSPVRLKPNILLTNRYLKREKYSHNGSLKSFSKDYLHSSITDDLVHSNQSFSSIYSNSYFLSKSFQFPLKSSDVLKYYENDLNEFERNEILSFNTIYYLGLKAKKLDVKSVKDYDDENGCYKQILHDQICYRYEILELLGKGSFGIVIKCFDHKTNEFIALKILKNKKRFQQQGFIEIQILKQLKFLDQLNAFHIVHIKEYFIFRSHLCITFELLGINLYELIQRNHFQGFSPNIVKRFTYSILQTLQILSDQQIIHCDLKPENILLKEKGSSQIKIIDFGSGCFQTNKIYTYIQSRFYRAPEIILGIPYTCAIDMWSLACIIVELFIGYPIFPGENEQEQLLMIMEVFNIPSNDFIQQGTRKQFFFDSKGQPRCYSSKSMKKHRPGSRPLSHILRTNDFNCLDFLHRCFKWNPNERLTPIQGLNHPWIHEYMKLQSRNKQQISVLNRSEEDNRSLKTHRRVSNQ